MALLNKLFGDIITFTRASGGGRVNAAGQFEWLAVNEPRFNYDPVTLQPRGLLIEEQRTNFYLYSDTISSGHPIVGSAGSAALQLGTVDGWAKLTRIAQGVAYINDTSKNTGTTATAAFDVKKGSSGFVSCRLQNIYPARADVRISPITGEYVLNTFGDATYGTPTVSVNVSDKGDYWRVSITATNPLASTALLLFSCGASFSDVLDSPNSTYSTPVEAYVRRVQLEAGSFASSYIPTSNAQVTRAADVISVNNLSPWYRADEGTLFAEFQPNEKAGIGDRRIASFGTQTGGGALDLVLRTDLKMSIDQSAVKGLVATQNTFSAGQVSRGAGVFKPGGYSVCLNGGAVNTYPANESASVIHLRLGSWAGGANSFLCGHIRSIRYYPRRLSDAELQALTA